MSDNKPELISPEQDNSHLSEATRLRMARVRELEQQRLQRVLARSVATAQQPPPSHQEAESAEPLSSSTVRSPHLGSRSSSLRSSGRARLAGRLARTMSEDRNDGVASRLPVRSEDSGSVVQTCEVDSQTGQKSDASGDQASAAKTSVFMKKLDELASTAENDKLKLRYQRLKELEEMRLSGKPDTDSESHPPSRGSTSLGRSASVNERVSSGRFSRRNSDQIRGRQGSPVMTRRTVQSEEDSSDTPISRAASTSNLYTPDLSSIDRIFGDRRQESLRRIEELSRLRQQGIRSVSLDVESEDRTSRERFLESLNVHPPRVLPTIEPISSVMFSRTIEPPLQYSSIDERFETISPRYGSDTSLNTSVSRVGLGSLDDLRRAGRESSQVQTTHVYHDPSVPGMTYVDEEGHSQWITPTSPLYKQMKSTDKTSSVNQTLEERKKRSLLARDGLEDHFLTECFDPEISFEERIGLIREKLYGSKVLIPSDKRRAMADRGCPDGASNALKDSTASASGGAEIEGHRLK